MTVAVSGLRKVEEIRPAQRAKILKLVHGNLAQP